MKQTGSQNGFTLIELMITVAIVAIVAKIAVPVYTSYSITSKLTEASNNLTSYRVQMEQSYQDNSYYGTGTTCTTTLPTGTYFTYTCTLQSSGQAFTATATSNGAGGLTSSSYIFTIDNNGNRVTTAFPSATVPTSCWLTSSGGC